ACVIGSDAAYHRRVNRCGIGPNLAAVSCQAPIGFSADDARLKRDRGRVGADLTSPPSIAQQNQDRIADRLPRQACSSRAKSHRRSKPRALGEEKDHFLFAFDNGGKLGYEAIEARVGSPSEQAQWISDQSIRRDA